MENSNIATAYGKHFKSSTPKRSARVRIGASSKQECRALVISDTMKRADAI
jgi:hypothetical protein